MILGYVIGTVNGVLIGHKFLGGSPTSRSALTLAALSAIRSFCLDALDEPIEQVSGGKNQISLACGGQLMVAVFSSVNTAVAMRLAKKYLDLVQQKLKNKEVTVSSPTLRETVSDELGKLDQEIEQLNSAN